MNCRDNFSLKCTYIWIIFFAVSCGRRESVSVSQSSLSSNNDYETQQSGQKNGDVQTKELLEKLIAVTTSTLAIETVTVFGSLPHISPRPTQTAEPSAATTRQSASAKSSTMGYSLSLTTPQPILLDSTNLEAIFRPIFAASGQLSATDVRYFTPMEKRNLGEYMMLETPNLETIRMGLPIQITQDYIFVLRTFAGRACSNLVSREASSVDDASNLLVKRNERKSTSISTRTVNNLMSRVFGFTPPAEGLHAGAQDFAALFNDSVGKAGTNGDNRTKDAAMIDNYKLLCVYVVTDPRSYSR
jgi:hypothetical protein